MLSEVYMYQFFGICVSLLTVSELLCDEFLKNFVIVTAIMLVVKSSVASAVFWIALFEVVLGPSVATSVVDFLVW